MRKRYREGGERECINIYICKEEREHVGRKEESERLIDLGIDDGWKDRYGEREGGTYAAIVIHS